MSIRMNPGMARLTVLGKGWNDNTVIDSGDGFTVDDESWDGYDEIWEDDDEIWGDNGEILDDDVFRFTVCTTTSNEFTFLLQGNVMVDWGDGSGDVISYSWMREASHRYAESSTEYTVSIAGDLQNISFSYYPSPDNPPHYYSPLLLASVLTPFPATMEAVEEFDHLFQGCRQLTSLPKGLFKNCPNAKSFRFAFAGEVSSTGNITSTYPMKLSEIPEDLFSYCPLAEDFSGCFRVCSMTSLPNKLFANLSKARSFAYCFLCCSKLESIPDGLFSGCTSAEDFRYCFGGYSFGSGYHQYAYGSRVVDIPEGLFSDCVNARNFKGCFYICPYLENIPQGLFDNCTNAEDFSFCFGGHYLGGWGGAINAKITAIPAGLFANNRAVTTFASCFQYGREITGALPALWETHSGANGANCFYWCTKAANYDSVPVEWGGEEGDTT